MHMILAMRGVYNDDDDDDNANDNNYTVPYIIRKNKANVIRIPAFVTCSKMIVP